MSEQTPQTTTGLPPEQEPKYTTDGRHIINRSSGEVIPHDEPVFIFRARDCHAADVLKFYANEVWAGDPTHLAVVRERIEDFARFAREHPDRMKQPDTERADG